MTLQHAEEIMGVRAEPEIDVESVSVKQCVHFRSYSRPFSILILLLGIWVYTGFTLYLNPGRAAFVCVCVTWLTFYLLNRLTRGKLAKQIKQAKKWLVKRLAPSPKVAKLLRWLSTLVVVTFIAICLIIPLYGESANWIPLGGLASLVVISVLGSTNPKKINWMLVIWGLMLQFLLGLIILWWPTGYLACQWLGEQVTTILGYTDLGSEFVFGEKYTDHPVVFKVLPTVVFFSSLVSILYHLGVMQVVIKVIATVIQFFLNSTPIESFAAAAHIFIGQVESSVALKPFWGQLTDSELHAIMTGGFATVAGTMFAAYVEFGVPAEHVLSASFMSAPAAIAVAKISFPETEESQIKTQKEIKMPSGQESNLIEALSVGATTAVKLVAYVVVNIIAFIATFGFLDAVLAYFGGLVNCPQLSFQLICSYVFRPLAAMMGVPWSETGVVGVLIGKKIFLNEFLAYIDLGTMIQAGEISDRSAVLSTYILCGFGSVAALGINLGSLSSAAPEMRPRFAKLLLRAMINGNIACFMTTCVAALLYPDNSYYREPVPDVNSTALPFNFTTIAHMITTT